VLTEMVPHSGADAVNVTGLLSPLQFMGGLLVAGMEPVPLPLSWVWHQVTP